MKKILAGALIVVASLFMLSASNVMAQGGPCPADFNCDQNVDAIDVDVFLQDFGRSIFNDPCPGCYDSPCPCNACPSGQVDCGGTCVDIGTDEDNCGLCGNACPSGFLCVFGVCLLSCQTELTNCAGTCVDTTKDEDNCGSCGNACGSDELCVASTCEPFGYPAPVERTGQTTCYNSSGTVISCTGTGQDGEYQEDVAWPNPRFTDNGDGTVTDNLTGLIWLEDANCFGTRNWDNALSDSNGLASGSCGLTDGSIAGDWRLPNRNELASLVDKAYYSPALPDTAGTGQWSEGDPFTGVQSNVYWSSTTSANGTTFAWYVYMDLGYVDYGYKSNNGYVWPVRGGND